MPTRKRLNRQKVLIEAIELANVKGLENLNLHELAAALEIKPPSLYNHIKSLVDLKQGIAIEATRALVKRIKDNAVGKSGPEALRAMAWAYLKYVRDNPGMVSAIARAPDKENQEAMAIDKEFIDTGMAIMAGFKMEHTESIHALRAIRCAAHGFAVLELEQGFGFDLKPDESFEWMINKLVDSFKQDTNTN